MLAIVALGATEVNLKIAQVKFTLCFAQDHILNFGFSGVLYSTMTIALTPKVERPQNCQNP